MATTIDISSEYLDDIYESNAIQVEADYILLTFSWSDIGTGVIKTEDNSSASPIIKKCIPEVVIEQALTDDEYSDWMPIFQQRTTYEEPVKFRLKDNSGKYSLNLYPLLAATYVRVKIYFNGAKSGTIIFNVAGSV
jgi:hypothetical protein